MARWEAGDPDSCVDLHQKRLGGDAAEQRSRWPSLCPPVLPVLPALLRLHTWPSTLSVSNVTVAFFFHIPLPPTSAVVVAMETDLEVERNAVV